MRGLTGIRRSPRIQTLGPKRLAVLFGASCIAACASTNESAPPSVLSVGFLESPLRVAGEPLPGGEVEPVSTGGVSDQAVEPMGARVDYGTGEFAQVLTRNESRNTETGGLSFQFRDAPIDLVLDQVLGEGFGASYIVDPAAQARLSLRLENVADIADAVEALNAGLASQGISIRLVGGSYIATRLSNPDQRGAQEVQILSENEVVRSDTAVFRLRHGNAETLTDLVAPLISPDTIKSVDAGRGLITLQGTQQDVAGAVDLLRAFDVDWFEATSSALIPLRTAPAGDVKREIDSVFDRTSGVETIALTRLNAVMVFARTPALIDRAQGLVSRLDRNAEPMISNEMLVYRAKYASPERLAQMARETIATSQSIPLTGTSGEGSPASLPTAFSVAWDDTSGVLAITGGQKQLERVERLFQALDVPQDQILIEVTVVEVTLRDEFRFGVQWSGLEGLVDFTFVDNESGDLTSRFPGVSIAYANTDIGAVLNVLDNETDIEIVSSPRILALNNETASITVGSEVPIITQSAVSVVDPGAPIVNSTEYRETGIILEVTPRVRAGGLVEIALNQEVSDVAESTTPGIISPTFSQRQLDSVLAVPDGATLALGGLFSSSRTQSEVGVPVLSDVPLVGGLFSSTSDTVRRTELVVLVRPQIVRSTTTDLDLSQTLRDALIRFRSSLEPVS